jgi:hypothetical protein
MNSAEIRRENINAMGNINSSSPIIMEMLIVMGPPLETKMKMQVEISDEMKMTKIYEIDLS